MLGVAWWLRSGCCLASTKRKAVVVPRAQRYMIFDNRVRILAFDVLIPAVDMWTQDTLFMSSPFPCVIERDRVTAVACSS